MTPVGVVAETPARAGTRQWLGLAVLALPTLLIAIDNSVLYLALPAITDDLGADETQGLWILDIYSFVLAGFLVTMGDLGDRIGRRRLLLIGAAAFGVASALAAFAPTPELLIVARAFLGVAGATLAPSTMALIRNMFPDPKQMGTAIGVWFACFMGGMLVGPIVGGALLQAFWWGAVFLMGVPVMIILLIVGPLLLPEYKPAGAGRIDLASTGLSLATILPVIWGLKEFVRGGDQLPAVAAIVIGVVFGVLFARRQLRLERPMIDFRIFRTAEIAYGLGANLMTGVVMAGATLLASFYLQTVAGLDPLTAGLWLIPQNVVMLIGFQLAPLLARRLPVPAIAAAGFLVAAAGFSVVATVTAQSGPMPVAVGISIASFGISFPMALLMALIMGATPPEKAGSVAAVSETFAEFGIAFGIAALGSVAAAVTAAQAPSMLPGVAFTTGFTTVAAITVVVYLLLAAIAIALLATRRGRTTDASPPGTATGVASDATSVQAA